MAWVWHLLLTFPYKADQLPIRRSTHILTHILTHIRNKYCINWELVSRQENERVCSSSLYAEMSEIETDTEERRQWLSSSCLSVVKIQTVWSADTTNKFQKGIAIKALKFFHSAQNITEHCYFQHESPETVSKRKPEP